MSSNQLFFLSHWQFRKSIAKLTMAHVSEVRQKDSGAERRTTDIHKSMENTTETAAPTLSKNQQKKRIKFLAKQENRKQRRVQERERVKQRRLKLKAEGVDLGPSRKTLKKRQAEVAAAKSDTVLQVIIDLDFDDYMNERDVAKCVKQCLRIYSTNRRSENPGKLYFTGIKTDGAVHKAFQKNDGWENWHVGYHFDQSHAEVFPAKDLVYLTCESDNVLDRLETNCIYVIGGLVDHNHQKGLCHERAVRNNLRTARLPLSEYVNMKTREVLSTFHVFEILVRLAEGNSWTDAIMQTLPVRKGAKRKELKTKEGEDGNEVPDEDESHSKKLKKIASIDADNGRNNKAEALSKN